MAMDLLLKLLPIWQPRKIIFFGFDLPDLIPKKQWTSIRGSLDTNEQEGDELHTL